MAVPMSAKLTLESAEAVALTRTRTERLIHLLLAVGAALGLLPTEETVGTGFIS